MPICRIATTPADVRPKFAAMDRLLDRLSTGPRWLAGDGVAQAVIGCLKRSEQAGFCELGDWVIMPNHVHLIVRPHVELPRWVSGLKRESAVEANRVLDRIGSFWAHGYHDRLIRDRDEEFRIRRYIDNNPVKAGLCSDPADWPYGSANVVHAGTHVRMTCER